MDCAWTLNSGRNLLLKELLTVQGSHGLGLINITPGPGTRYASLASLDQGFRLTQSPPYRCRLDYIPAFDPVSCK